MTATTAARVTDAVKVYGAGDTSEFAFAVPGLRLLVVASVGVAAGVLAALRPARRAARLNVLGAVAAE
ncbi:hypothetical protein IAG44_05110 [Streptomyces roseirectus]|uniref:Uncharacterized protein n=1 Tax=Streptomyces roseirectus TaxID=2768066 RepID=A0A7H0ITV7_9ACTN|nr:hypothetical protein [Streptomyces roseirectus]QNP76223.1 hypothetical protein IAG44_05110 [Streptomyces roseirectus]